MSEQIDFFDAARDAAIEWARLVLADPNVVILDTETTGLGGNDQIIQISIMGMNGSEILNEMIQPTVPINPDAQRVHGISRKMLEDKPFFPDIYPRIVEATYQKDVIIYNAEFDVRMLRQSCEAFRDNCVPPGIVWETEFDCAMINYAQFCGEWNDYRGSFRWQRLPGGDHSAMGDCKATLEVIRMMAAAKLTSEKEEASHA